MNYRLTVIPAAALALAALSGCTSQAYYAPPPPPRAYAPVAPLIETAEHNGFLAGQQDGARDAYYGRGYRPQGDRTFRVAPGYDPNLGPREPYVDHFRSAYLRGYDKAFYRR